MRIVVNNLNTYYGNKNILKNVSFHVESGEFFVILGPNGSGKTTLLRSLSGILPVMKQTIFLDGEDLTTIHHSRLAKLLAVLEPEIKPGFAYEVEEMVSLGRLPFPLSHPDNNKEIIINALKLTNTYHFRNKSIFHLSSGERQRVWFAMALAQEPKILILDEPVSHLDIKYQIEILSLIRQLCAQKITVVATIHDLNLAQHASRILLLKNGNVNTIGNAKEVLTKQKIREVFEVNTEIRTEPFAIIPSLNE